MVLVVVELRGNARVDLLVEDQNYHGVGDDGHKCDDDVAIWVKQGARLGILGKEWDIEEALLAVNVALTMIREEEEEERGVSR